MEMRNLNKEIVARERGVTEEDKDAGVRRQCRGANIEKNGGLTIDLRRAR